MWHQFISCNQAAAFWDLFSDANISQGWQLFTANQCLLKWIRFMLNPKSVQGQPSYVQNLIIHCHPYALADQSATCIFGPQGSAQVIFPPFFPPRDPPISLAHPNMDVFNANSSVTDLRSSSKGRPWGSSDLWRSRDLRWLCVRNPSTLSAPCPLRSFSTSLGVCLLLFSAKPTSLRLMPIKIRRTTCYLWNPMKNGEYSPYQLVQDSFWWAVWMLEVPSNMACPWGRPDMAVAHQLCHRELGLWIKAWGIVLPQWPGLVGLAKDKEMLEDV